MALALLEYKLMARRACTGWLAWMVIIHGAAGAAEPRVAFANNRLTVDGKPMFFYGCWGTPNGDYQDFKRRHFNVAFMSWSAAVNEGPKAADQGLMVIPYPYAPGWNDKVKAAVGSLAKEDWVLAWNIGDDLKSQEHIDAALRVRDEIRKLDPQHRPIMFDAIGLYEQFATIPDMWCAYAYPLVKDAEAAPPARKPGGLREYGDWLDRMRLLGRPDAFFWTWTQCHVQIWYCEKYLGGTAKDKWRPSAFPDGDHLRLIAAHAISSGSRGLLWFVHRYFQDSHLGRDRYARASLIGCELEVLGPLIAQGKVGKRLKTSDPSVWATPIDFPCGQLICLLKTGDRYHYQPDAANVVDVQIETKANGRTYQIGDTITELADSKCSFVLTSWLLVTPDQPLVQRLRGQCQKLLPDKARFAAEELEARIAKVKPLFAQLDARQLPRQPQELSSQVQRAIAQARWADACRLAEQALTAIRTAQHRVWRGLWTDEVLSTGLRLTDFYMLPLVAKDIRLLQQDSWGSNQLPNGSFESAKGWDGLRATRRSKSTATRPANTGRDGSSALRLAASSPAMYEGEPRDWVTVNVVSEKIPAQAGQMWEIAAWVRVPKMLEQTNRGVTIALFAYDNQGQAIRGYGAKDLEAVHVAATDQWQRMRLVVPLRSPAIASIAARLALCGVGEAYVDDVIVRRLTTSP